MNLAAARFDVGGRDSIEIGERNRWEAHASSFGRLEERIAKHQRGVAHGDLVEIVVERADQYRRPEAIDRLLRLSVAQQPRLEIFVGVGGQRGHQRQQRARDRQLVFQVEHGRSQEREARCAWARAARSAASTDDLPPGRMKVISSYQRIWFSTPRRR